MGQKLTNISQNVVQFVNKYGKAFGVGNVDGSSWAARAAFKWMMIKSFWLTVIAAFSILTIQSGAALVEQFLAGNTVSVLTLINNQPFAVPKGTVCLPVYGFTLNELFQKGNGTTAGVIEYFSQEGITKEKFLANGGHLQWPRTVLDYLTTMTLSEAGLWSQTTFEFSSNYSVMNQLDPNDYRDHSWIGYFNNYTLRDYLNEDSWNAQLVMEDYLDQLGITVEEMKQGLGRELIRHFSLTASHYALENGKMAFHQITNFQIAYITWYLTCFDIDFPSKNISLKSTKEFVYVQMDPSPSLSARKNGYYSTKNMLYDALGRFGTDMQQNTIEMNNTDNNMYTELGWNNKFGISVQAVYQAMPIVNGETKCTEGELLDTREWNCRVERIQMQCNCTPVMIPLLSVATKIPTKGSCSFAKLNGCLNYEAGSDNNCQKEECRFKSEIFRNGDRDYDSAGECIGEYSKELLPDCENRKLEIPKPTAAPSVGHGQLARITIIVNDLTSPVFVEQYVWTTEEFISALGGVLGLWLGFDFFITIQITVAVASFVFQMVMAAWRAENKT